MGGCRGNVCVRVGEAGCRGECVRVGVAGCRGECMCEGGCGWV